MNKRKLDNGGESGEDGKERARKLDRIYFVAAGAMLILLVLSYVKFPSINLKKLKSSIPTISIKLPEKTGTTKGNFSNMGLAVEKDNWIYYINFEDEHKIYKVNKNGGEKTVFINEPAHSLNIWKNELFYVNDLDWKIYKVDLKEGKKSLFINEPTDKVLIYEDWIYFRKLPYGIEENQEASDYYNIFRVKIDGTKKTNISKKGVGVFNISNGKIYFTGIDNEVGMYTCKLNGEGLSKISEDGVGEFWVDNKYIYYSSNSSPRPTLIRMKKNGEGGTEIPGISGISAANMTDKHIYFSSGSGLYKTDKDGENVEVLDNNQNQSISAINIVGDWIYCTDYVGGFRIKTSGQAREEEKGLPKDILIKDIKGDRSQNDIKHGDKNYTGIICSGDFVFYSMGNKTIQYNIKTNEKKVVLNQFAGNMDVFGEYLYFTNGFNKIYRIKTDGNGEMEEFFNERVTSFVIYGDYVYYTKLKDNYGLYRIKLDGSQNEKVFEGMFDTYYIKEGYIYYLNYNSGIYKVNTNTKEVQELVGAPVNQKFILAGDYIYYYSKIDNGGIFKVGIDGRDNKKILNGGYSPTMVTDQHIYFTKSFEEGPIQMRSGLDGKNIEDTEIDSQRIFRSGENIYFISNRENTLSKMDMKTKKVTIIEDGVR